MSVSASQSSCDTQGSTTNRGDQGGVSSPKGKDELAIDDQIFTDQEKRSIGTSERPVSIKKGSAKCGGAERGAGELREGVDDIEVDGSDHEVGFEDSVASRGRRGRLPGCGQALARRSQAGRVKPAVPQSVVEENARLTQLDKDVSSVLIGCLRSLILMWCFVRSIALVMIISSRFRSHHSRLKW